MTKVVLSSLNEVGYITLEVYCGVLE